MEPSGRNRWQTVANATAPSMSEHEGRKPDNRLHTIAGRCHTSGHVIAEPKIPVVGTDTYEVLPGGYFLVHHVDVTVGERPVRAIEIIGEPDAGSGGFFARASTAIGNAELMRVRSTTAASSTSPAKPRWDQPHNRQMHGLLESDPR